MPEIAPTRHKNIWNIFSQALLAAKIDQDQRRQYRLGAIGITESGRIIRARNSASKNACPWHHAEARLASKLPPKSTVFVARARKDGSIGLAQPCSHCRARLKTAKVKRVYYTIDNHNYGMIPLE